jgi:pyruvate,water dikinase
MNAYVIGFEALGVHDVPRVGGKNASLGEMISRLSDAGVSVPGGFATTADAYRDFLAQGGLDERIWAALDRLDIADVAALAQTGEAIRRWVVEQPFPPELEQAIAAAYAELARDAGEGFSVAVRSSATAEDLPDASFAGQQETYLNISGLDGVLHAVKLVFASLFNDRAIAYREHQGFEHRKVLLSAGVQRMVRSDLAASGVMFTLDTETGFRDAVFIASAYGLGELVVQGAVDPDEFYVYKPALAAGKSAVVRRSLGKKGVKMLYDPAKAVVTVDTPEAERRRFSITDAEAEQLGRLAIVIERHYGRPMDIEWAKDGLDGGLYIVQARPETVQSRATREIERYQLKGTGTVLAQGRSVGHKIGAGRAKVIQSVAQMDLVQPGDVLVTDMTDPDWEPIMKRASAIVTNRGGRTCFSGDTRLLTNVGFMTFRELEERGHEGISVPSLNRGTLKIEWKPVLAVMKRTAELIRVGFSQTGRMRGNHLDLTPDHKMLNLSAAELVDTEIQTLLARDECALLADHLPQLSSSTDKERSLAYLLGGIMTDGHIYLSRTHGEVTFIQKPETAKQNFIARMNQALLDNYGKAFKESVKQVSNGFIRGQQVIGQANAYRCYSKSIATALRAEQDTIVTTLLKSDVEIACHFLAGVIDGDGSYLNGRVNLYVAAGELLEAVIVACLRIGIVPSVTTNRTIYNVQIVEKLDLLGRYTQRVSCRDQRGMGSRYFNAKQLLTDNINWDVNNRVRKNLLIDALGLADHLPDIADSALRHRIEKLLASDFRQIRAKFEANLGEGEVYNITVADNRNYLVFTARYSPILVNNCHAAIIARELGIPAVVGCGDATATIPAGTEVTVSCAEGDTGHVYAGRLPFEVNRINLDAMPGLPLKLMMNVGSPERAFAFAGIPNDGVGLARIEFVIARMIGIHPKALLEFDRQTPELQAAIQERIAGYADPVGFYVDKLAEGIATIGAAFAPKPVIVRTSDFKTNEYANLLGGERYEPKEENPMIGFRGASRYVAESFRDCFELECRALKKVREDMGLTNVQVMIPFVRTLEEARGVAELLERFGLPRGANGLQWIMMCEIPSNPLLADEFLDIFDGFSIGSNDLTQLTLGIDRDSGLVAGGFDERNPAVKALIRRAIQVCRRRGKYIGICGQGPSDHPDLALWLLQEGIGSLSLNPDTVVETWMFLAGNAQPG